MCHVHQNAVISIQAPMFQGPAPGQCRNLGAVHASFEKIVAWVCKVEELSRISGSRILSGI